MRTICISDLHLGSKVCEHKKLKKFLTEAIDKDTKLVLNGDVFDHHKIKKFSLKDLDILMLLEKMSKEIEVIWVKGNHDKLFHKDDVLKNSKKHIDFYHDNGIFFVHGDKFDTMLNRYKALESLADFVYVTLQKIDETHATPRLLKKLSKHCLKVRNIVKNGALDFVNGNNCKIICGHTHYHTEEDPYYNCGCWTEKPCTFAVIENGVVKINEY